MKKFLFFTALFFAHTLNLCAAWLENVPITVKQPDGSELNCFATDDEFYNRVHDKDGLILIREPKTGWVVYAELRSDELVSPDHQAGSITPASLGLKPWINLLVKTY